MREKQPEAPFPPQVQSFEAVELDQLECLERLPSDLLADAPAEGPPIKGCISNVGAAERVPSKGLSRFAPHTPSSSQSSHPQGPTASSSQPLSAPSLLLASEQGLSQPAGPRNDSRQAWESAAEVPKINSHDKENRPKVHAKAGSQQEAEALVEHPNTQLAPMTMPDPRFLTEPDVLKVNGPSQRQGSLLATDGTLTAEGAKALALSIPGFGTRPKTNPGINMSSKEAQVKASNGPGPALEAPNQKEALQLALEPAEDLPSKMQSCTLDGDLTAELGAISVPCSVDLYQPKDPEHIQSHAELGPSNETLLDLPDQQKIISCSHRPETPCRYSEATLRPAALTSR